MVNIRQANIEISLKDKLDKGRCSVVLNRQSIADDISRITDELDKYKGSNRHYVDNGVSVINYLRNLSNYVKKRSSVDIKWVYKDGIVKSTPIELINIEEYGVYLTDYVEVDNEKMVYLSYKDVSEILAFEIMHRDLGYTDKEMEELLKDVGIVVVYKAEELTKHFREKPHMLSKVLKIEKSAYIDRETGCINDYFGTKQFNMGWYKDVVEYTCKHAMAIILENLLHSMYVSKVKYKLVSVSDVGIHIKINKKDIDKIVEQDKGVVVRSLGRKFLVEPDISIY